MIVFLAGIIALAICLVGLTLSILRLVWAVFGLRVMVCLALVIWFAVRQAPVDPKKTPLPSGPRPYNCSLCVVPK